MVLSFTQKPFTCVSACVRGCARTCVRACVWVRAWVRVRANPQMVFIVFAMTPPDNEYDSDTAIIVLKNAFAVLFCRKAADLLCHCWMMASACRFHFSLHVLPTSSHLSCISVEGDSTYV